MTVKDLKKKLKGLDNCKLLLRAYDNDGYPHLIDTFDIITIETFSGWFDPDETRIAVINPEYELTDETKENHGNN
jgi:hypothetical protein